MKSGMLRLTVIDSVEGKFVRQLVHKDASDHHRQIGANTHVPEQSERSIRRKRIIVGFKPSRTEPLGIVKDCGIAMRITNTDS